jgi:hypothetical protein
VCVQHLSSHRQMVPFLASPLSSSSVRATGLNRTVGSFIAALLVSCELWKPRSRLNLSDPIEEKVIQRRPLDTARLSRVCCLETWKKQGATPRDSTGLASIREKRRSRHASQVLLLFLCMAIRTVHVSASVYSGYAMHLPSFFSPL